MSFNVNSFFSPNPSPLAREGRGWGFRVVLPVLWCLLIICMATATIVEKIEDKAGAEAIYGSWWFAAMWGALAIVAMAYLLRKKVQKRLAVFMLHVSFVVMLAGSLVTHLTAESGTLHLRVGEPVSRYLSESNTPMPLPFDVTLTNFEIHNYPGTDAVMDYRCNIDVRHDGDVEKMSVSMNNIGKADGYRFYQSSYDADCLGTVLLVAYDPYGIAITYLGYLMLAVSMLWTMFSRHTRIRQLYRLATKPMLLLLLCLFPATATLSANDDAPQSRNGKTAEIAHAFGKVVTMYNGRLCPINTPATEFVTKLCGKSSWDGYSADEIFMGWMIYYTEWEQRKIILVKNSEVQRILGIDGKWACVKDFYTPDNKYKLSGMANSQDISAATRKAIREVDEKIQVIAMFYNSEMLRIFPLEASPESVPDGRNMVQNGTGGRRPGLVWHTPGSTELPLDIPNAEFQFINHAMDNFVKSVLVNDVEGAKVMIGKIKLYQKEKAGNVLPSAALISMEVVCNSMQSARWVVFMCLTLSLVFCILALLKNGSEVRESKRWKTVSIMHLVYVLVQTSFLAVLFVLRWIVSGHVPMSNGYETMLFMSLATLVITLAVMRRIPVMKAFGPVVASLCMLVAMLAVGSPQITQLMPVLQSPLLSIHVALVMTAYALLAIITLIAIHSLVLSSSSKDITANTALSQLLLYPAVVCLTLGIFVGAVWANVSWGSYWSWDPKETWALITLMIYAVPLHRSAMPASAAKYHLYILLSFLTVLMTYFGVNYFLTGMHSYA